MPILQYPDAPLWDDMTAEQRQAMARTLRDRYQQLLARAAALPPAPDPEPEEAPAFQPL
jgi:hypothetical protein